MHASNRGEHTSKGCDEAGSGLPSIPNPVLDFMGIKPQWQPALGKFTLPSGQKGGLMFPGLSRGIQFSNEPRR